MKRFLSFSLIIGIVFLFTSQLGADTSLGDFYKVGINDVIEVKVLDHADLRTVTPVTSDGTISFPYIGTIQVENMSLSEIKEMISKKLGAGYIKYPVVTVTLVKSMSRKIFAYGELNRRGEIPYEEGMTLVRALSIAGGISRDGLYGNIKVRRKTKGKPGFKDINVDIEKVVGGSRKADLLLKPDDIVIVERNKTFFAYGEVGKPGEHVLEKNMTVVRALSVVGGIRADGLYGKVKIRRKQKDKKIKDMEIDIADIVEGRGAGDMLLQPDDLLIVERNKTFLIQGEVMKRGRFVLSKDMTVLRALLQAGGISDSASYGTITLRRKKKGKAGEYQDIAEAKVIEMSKIEDILLQPDDVLVVEGNETFLVYGEVLRPGEVVLQSDMTAFKAITMAGGFTKWGSENRVKILRQKKDTSGFETIKVNIDNVIRGKADADVALEPGDILVISAGVF